MESIEPTSQEALGATEISSIRSIAGQVAAYAGVAMGLVGTLALLATSADPSETTLLLVAIAVTAVLFAAGLAIGRDAVASSQRLRSVLWFAALFGWGVVVEAILVVAEIDPGGRARQLLSSALVAPVAVGLWFGLRRTLQLLGMFFALYTVLVAAVFPQPDPFGQPDLVATAVLTWAFGAAWMVLGARGVIPPARTALVLGTIAVLLAPLLLVIEGAASDRTLTVVELWILGGGVACLIVGSWLADRAVQGLAIVGVLGGVAVLVADLVADSHGGQIAAVVLGMVLLAGAVAAIRSGGGTWGEPAPLAPTGILPGPPTP